MVNKMGEILDDGLQDTVIKNIKLKLDFEKQHFIRVERNK